MKGKAAEKGKTGGQDDAGNKETADKSKPTLPVDPLYKYTVATALYQHTRLIDALIDAYDRVIVECGPAEIGSLSRLTRNEHAEIILSVPRVDEEELAELEDLVPEEGVVVLVVQRLLVELVMAVKVVMV